MRFKTLGLAAFLLLSTCIHAQNNRRDGNGWIDETPLSKLNYVTGIFDGMQLGHHFSIWGLMTHKETETKYSSCISTIAESYHTNNNKFLSNVTNGQLVDGLDKFYSDFRNRRIRVSDGVWIVLKEIAGTPQKQIDTMIENWGQSATEE